MNQVVVLIFPGVEEIEALTPVDLLRRAGVRVDLLSVTGETRITGRNGIQLTADGCLAAAADAPAALVVVPGGPGHTALLDDQAVLEWLRQQSAGGAWLGSICAGPLILQAAGLLEGKRFTAFPGTAPLFARAPLDEALVQDGRLITAQGAGTAFPFALALVAAVCGSEAATSIASETCYRG